MQQTAYKDLQSREAVMIDPLAHQASYGKAFNNFSDRLETDRGKKKAFYFLDGNNHAGVAQGHSLSPLLSVIVIEHALRSLLQRMKAAHPDINAIMYADDGIFFSNTRFQEGFIAKFWKAWGMHIATDKSK